MCIQHPTLLAPQQPQLVPSETLAALPTFLHEAITIRLEAIASRLEAIASGLEAIAIRLEAIGIRLRGNQY